MTKQKYQTNENKQTPSIAEQYRIKCGENPNGGSDLNARGRRLARVRRNIVQGKQWRTLYEMQRVEQEHEDPDDYGWPIYSGGMYL